MRIAAIIVSVLALIAMAGGVFFFWIVSAFMCFDVCPSVTFAGQQLPRIIALTLGPGVILSLAAWIISLLYTRANGRSAVFIVTLIAPIVLAIAVILILLLAGGSLTPVAVSGPPEVAPANRQVSIDWLDVTRYAVMPLVIWPLISLIVAIPRPAKPQG